MNNVMTINGQKAVINYDPEIDMFRGEFIGLNGGADFYASDIEGLRREGEISLRAFMEMCKEDGVTYSVLSLKGALRKPKKPISLKAMNSVTRQSGKNRIQPR
jgi:predicted HicB family RNase H-like nuclease